MGGALTIKATSATGDTANHSQACRTVNRVAGATGSFYSRTGRSQRWAVQKPKPRAPWQVREARKLLRDVPVPLFTVHVA